MLDCLIGQKTLKASKLQCNFTPKLRNNQSFTMQGFLAFFIRKDWEKGGQHIMLRMKIVIFMTACLKAARKKSATHFNRDVQFLSIDTSAKGLPHVWRNNDP